MRLYSYVFSTDCIEIRLLDMLSIISELASIAASLITVVAIIVGGSFAVFKFRVFRESKPHLTVSQEVRHRFIGTNFIHVVTYMKLHNSSKVAVQISGAMIRAQMVSPAFDDQIQTLYDSSGSENGHDTKRDPDTDEGAWSANDTHDSVPLWPLLETINRSWEKGELIIEPGGTDSQAYEFIIHRGIEAVLIYAHFQNADFKPKKKVPRGWDVTTVYDVKND